MSVCPVSGDISCVIFGVDTTALPDRTRACRIVDFRANLFSDKYDAGKPLIRRGVPPGIGMRLGISISRGVSPNFTILCLCSWLFVRMHHCHCKQRVINYTQY